MRYFTLQTAATYSVFVLYEDGRERCIHCDGDNSTIKDEWSEKIHPADINEATILELLVKSNPDCEVVEITEDEAFIAAI